MADGKSGPETLSMMSFSSGVQLARPLQREGQPLRWADPIANRETRHASRSLAGWEIISNKTKQREGRGNWALLTSIVVLYQNLFINLFEEQSWLL